MTKHWYQLIAVTYVYAGNKEAAEREAHILDVNDESVNLISRLDAVAALGEDFVDHMESEQDHHEVRQVIAWWCENPAPSTRKARNDALNIRLKEKWDTEQQANIQRQWTGLGDAKDYGTDLIAMLKAAIALAEEETP